MSVDQRLSPAVDPAIRMAVQPGEWVARHTFTGASDSDRFRVEVVLGQLADALIEAPSDYPDAIVVNLAAGAKDHFEAGYNSGGMSATEQERLMHRNMEFVHGRQMLLRNVITLPDQVAEAIEDLTDNARLAANDCSWQVSTLGPNLTRLFHRGLYVASGVPELNIPRDPKRQFTYPEMRADAVSVVAARALDGFMIMPPSAD